VKKINIISFAVFLFLFASQNLSAQRVHSYFNNFSFEDFPRPGVTPRAWTSPHVKNQSPPDIHPTGPPVFEVVQQPYHGSTYIGLVTRANKTWESVYQPLEVPLKKQACYFVSIYLCQSPTYKSKTNWAGEETINFTAPTILRVWGIYGESQSVLLTETAPVENVDWKKYTLVLSPDQDIHSLILEAYYPDEFEFTNGHILLDNISPIFKLSCEEKDNPLPEKEAAARISNHLELLYLIESQGGKIEFDENDLLTSSSKTVLKQIGEKLKDAKDKRLLIYLKTSNRRKYRSRFNTFEQITMELDYPIDMYEVKRIKVKTPNKNWISKSQDIYIGLGIR